jgi:predicted RNA-binding Zn-ribbon protein involved in translation (DUF1610 family)
MQLETYGYSEADQVQCPRCGQLGEIALASHTGQILEYAGVCQSLLPSDVSCGAVLRLQVITHVFPAPEATR